MSKRTLDIRLIPRCGPTVTLDIKSWGAVYNLALDHGWQPMGSEAPAGWQPTDESGWSGTYVMPRGQIVGMVDARHLAGALVRGLESGAADLDEAAVREVICVCRSGRFSIG